MTYYVYDLHYDHMRLHGKYDDSKKASEGELIGSRLDGLLPKAIFLSQLTGCVFL